MSSSRRQSPLNQRPRRRRRLESFTSHTTDQQLDQYDPFPVTPTMNPNAQASQASQSSNLFTAGAFAQQSSSSNAFSSNATSNNASSSSAPAHQATSIQSPRIPLSAVLTPENLPVDKNRAVASNQPFPGFSDDGDDLSDDESVTGLFVANNNNGIGIRSREALNIVQDHNRIANRRRNMVTPRVGAPSALVLFEREALDSDFSQQDRSSPSPSSAVRYLVLIPTPSKRRSSLANAAQAGLTQYTLHPWHKTAIDSHRAGPSRAHWVPGQVPLELFGAITQHLSRDDIKNMRLVNKDFERAVSGFLFDTVVVPFNTELYDMIEQDKTVKKDTKGKGRADEPKLGNTLHWKNDKEDELYNGHGLRVFEGFGSHIKKFGMSFEVKEDALRNPPLKKALDKLESYFGSYDWPSVEYTRFDMLAGLERTADEVSHMKLAFSHLSKVKQLALSIDSGLGWMAGPDKSLRSQILQHATPIFGGCSYGIEDTQRQQRDAFFSVLESAYDASGKLYEVKEGRLRSAEMLGSIPSLQGLAGTKYCDTSMWPTIDAEVIDLTTQESAAAEDRTQPLKAGVLYIQPYETELPEPNPNGETEASVLKAKPSRPAFLPASLDKHQKEWLLEADWAQRAFAMSYMLAVVDNEAVFSHITTLKLARISSRLIPLFYRHDFWNALPNLSKVIVGVIPDWRTVERDEAGFVETADIEPSKAHEAAYKLLSDYIGPRSSIKTIEFAWVGGGENAEGCFARNNHVLPAPITLLPHTVQSLVSDPAMLYLPHVEYLVLSNCWIAPPAIINLVQDLESASLKKITLDSVSLTAHPKNAAVQNGGNQNIAANNAFAWNQMLVGGFGGFNLQPGIILGQQNQPPVQVPTPPAAHQFAALFFQGVQGGQPAQVWAQNLLQQLQQIMAQNNIPNHQQLGHMVTNHFGGITMGQIWQSLTMLATGMAGMFVGNAQAQLAALQNPQNQIPGALAAWILGLPGGLPGLGNMQAVAGAAGGGMQGGWNPPGQAGIGGGAAALPPAAPPVNHQWYEGHRDGSWMTVLDVLSPGPNLNMYKPRDEFDPIPEKRTTQLTEIELVSCGYVQLPNPPFDQSRLQNPNGPTQFDNMYLQRRRSLLNSSMLSTSDRHLGQIVQYMPEREQDALRFSWDFNSGWDDAKQAQVVEYDGYLPGGTGRISGVITKHSPIGASAPG